MPEDLAERLAAVRERIARAAARAGRDPAGVTLVAVTKGVDPARVAEAAAAGALDVGENRAQELAAKQAALATDPRTAGLRWHFVGVLQRNKARAVTGRVVLVHGVDGEELARAISDRAVRGGVVQDVLLEVNAGGEPQKAGVAPEGVAAAAAALAGLPGIRLRGLMTVAPEAVDPDRARPAFARLRGLSEQVVTLLPGAVELSMGMSADFEVAVEEGATIVRVGSAIFGPRPGRR